jgi:hypothetical protein
MTLQENAEDGNAGSVCGSRSETVVDESRRGRYRTTCVDFGVSGNGWLLCGQWCNAVRGNPASFKKKLRLACQDPEICSRAAWANSRHLHSLGQTWQCGDCEQSFKSRQASAVHRVRKHSFRQMSHWLVEDTSCPACLKEFWTRHKALEHLQEKAPRCCAYIALTAPRLSDARVDELDEDARQYAKSMNTVGSRRATALRTAIRLSGPLPNVPMEELPTGRHHPLGIGHRWLN